MKYIINHSLHICLVVAIVLASCAKVDDPIKEDDNGNSGNVDVDEPSISFVATMVDALDTKTTISDPDENTSSIGWSSGDQISVNGETLSIVSGPTGTPAQTAEFAGRVEIEGIGGKYFASYNCGTVSLDKTNSTQSFTFPTEQTYGTGNGSYGGLIGSNSIPMLAVAVVPTAGTTGAVSLSFKNACAIIDIKLKASSFSVGKIELCAVEKCFSGTVTMNSSGTISFSNGGATGNDVVTLTMPTGGIALNGSSYTHFGIKVPPLANGTMLTVKIYNNSGGNVPYASGTIIVSNGTSGYDLSNLIKVPVKLIDGQLPGVFQIGENKYVQFSKGNLQFQASQDGVQYSPKWRFAEKQWYHYANGNGSISENNGNSTVGEDRAKQTKWIDLFRYGTSGASDDSKTYYPYSYKNDNTYYPTVSLYGANDKYDWGVNNFNGDGWRTMTIEEWRYLFYVDGNTSGTKRTNHGFGTIEGIKGLIILPTNWTLPSDCTFDINSYNTYTKEQWIKMENNGAVFLPFSGGKIESYESGGQYYVDTYLGYYQSSSIVNGQTYSAYDFTINYDNKSITATGYTWKQYGKFVRLVRDVQKPYSSGDYVDEYGVNRGQGITINGVTWAPVNCGYIAPGETIYGTYYDKGYPNGKLYQWGRKVGNGSYKKDTTNVNRDENWYRDFTHTSEAIGSVNANNAKYFFPNSSDWASTSNNNAWNLSSEDQPRKSNNDPCPNGWRVPTWTELDGLKKIGTGNTNLFGISGGNTIVLPYCGYLKYNQTNAQNDYRGGENLNLYWSSKCSSNAAAYAKSFNQVNSSTFTKAYGCAVRCVKE